MIYYVSMCKINTLEIYLCMVLVKSNFYRGEYVNYAPG